MKTASTKTRQQRRISKQCLPALIAVGSSVAYGPAAALELGELKVHSSLGQPLRASIAFALHAEERISESCLSLQSGPSTSGLPNLGNARLFVGDGTIVLLGETPVREPMVSAQLLINCPDAPNLSREYFVFVDPYKDLPQPVSAPPFEESAAIRYATPAQVVVDAGAAKVVTPASAATTEEAVVRDIDLATRYQVRPGDTLSGIAERIQKRPVGLWQAVDAIFQANREAFIDANPNQLKAGVWISIPAFDNLEAVAEARSNDKVTAGIEPPARAEMLSEPVALYEPPIAVEPSPAATTPDFETAVASQTADLQAGGATDTGGIVLDDLNHSDAAVATRSEPDIILDTALPEPESTSQSPNAITAVVSPNQISNESQSPSSAWPLWLATAAIAIVLGLALFRRRFGISLDTRPTPPATGDHPMRRFTDTQTVAAGSNTQAQDDLDDDDSPTVESIVLDARLDMTAEIEKSFSDKTPHDTEQAALAGISATRELDIDFSELPDDATFELVLDETGNQHTLTFENPDDDYDMSVIVDSTRNPHPDDATAHEFKAVEVVPDNVPVLTTTLERDTGQDYQVLEQDYEDELTATQALNLEIARAAAELTAKLEIRQAGDTPETSGETTAVKLATVTELDRTTELPAQKPESDDNDTVEMPAGSEKAS